MLRNSNFTAFIAGMSVGALGMFAITRIIKKNNSQSGPIPQQTSAVSEHKQNQIPFEQKVVPRVIEQKAVPRVIEQKEPSVISEPSPQRHQETPRIASTLSSILSLATCPITGEIIKHAATTTCGQTYERSAIQAWLDGGHTTDPKTRQTITARLTVNYLAQDLIEGMLNLSSDPHKTQQEIQSEQNIIASLVDPLQSYAYATGIQKFKSSHQAYARKILTELRCRLHLLNRCDESELHDKVKDLIHWISAQKPSKNSGEYCNSLEKVKINILNHYMALTQKNAPLRSRP